MAQGAERAGSQGAEAVYTDNAVERAEIRELLYLTAVVQDAALPDAIIEKQSCRTLCGHHHEPLTDEGYISPVSAFWIFRKPAESWIWPPMAVRWTLATRRMS